MKRVQPESRISIPAAKPKPEDKHQVDAQLSSPYVLERLPKEVVQHIAGHLTRPDLASLVMCSKQLAQWCDEIVCSAPPKLLPRMAVYFSHGDDALNLRRALWNWIRKSQWPSSSLTQVQDHLPPLSATAESIRAVVPRAGRRFEAIHAMDILLDKCWPKLYDKAGWKTLDVTVTSMQALWGLFLSIRMTPPSNPQLKQSLRLFFDGDTMENAAEWRPLFEGDCGIPITALHCHSFYQLAALKCNLSEVKSLAIHYEFFQNGGRWQDVKNKLPALTELAIKDNIPELLDLLENIPSIEAISVINENYSPDELDVFPNLFRSNVRKVHLRHLEFTENDLNKIAAGPSRGKVESLHLLNCRFANLQSLENLLSILPRLSTLEVGKIRVGNGSTGLSKILATWAKKPNRTLVFDEKAND